MDAPDGLRRSRRSHLQPAQRAGCPNHCCVYYLCATIACVKLAVSSCLNPCDQLETLLPFIVRIGLGASRRSGVADAFAISRPASHPTVFVAQQFCELAIDVHDESFIGQLAGGDADCRPFEQHVRRFIPVCQ